MPTGGAAIMKQGPNLVYFARKEQALALGKQLRTDFKINDYRKIICRLSQRLDNILVPLIYKK